jgi:hypothetical protein
MIPARPPEGCNVGTPAYVLIIGTYGGIMLSTFTAADALFRHDAGTRARELAILASMRDRREGLTAAARMPITPRRAITWPRPIGVNTELRVTAAVCA